MAFNGSGVFDPPPTPQYPAVAGDVIYASRFNAVMQEVFDGLSNCFTKDGQSTPTADFNFGNRKIANVSKVIIGTLTDNGNALQVTGNCSFAGTVALPSTTSIGSVAASEISYLSGVTSNIQTQLNAKASLASPALTGVPTAPTAAPGTNTAQVSTTAFVQAAIAALVASSPAALDTLNELAAALGNDPNFATSMATQLGLKAPLASPTFTGTVVLPATTSIGPVSATEIGYLDNVTSNIQTQLNAKEASIAAGTTAQYWRGDKSWQTLDKTAVGLGSVDNTSDATKNSATATLTNKTLVSPVLNGTPIAPTAAFGNNTQQIATTAFVQTAFSSAQSSFTPVLEGSSVPGTPTYMYRIGKAIRLGNLVFFSLQLNWSNITGASGAIKITGLPYRCEIDAAVSCFALDGLPVGAGKTLVATVSGDPAAIFLYAHDSATGNTNNVLMDTAAELTVAGCYFTY